MRLWDPAFVGAKLVSVAILASGIRFLPNAIWLLKDRPTSGEAIAAITHPLLLFAVAFVLWRKAAAFADLVANEADEAIPGEGAEPAVARGWERADVVSVGVAIIGVYLVATGIPALVRALIDVAFPSSVGLYPQSSVTPYRTENLYTAIGEIVRVLVGLWLMVSTKTVADLIERARHRQPQARPEDETSEF